MFGISIRHSIGSYVRAFALTAGLAAGVGFAQDQLYSEMFPLSAVKLFSMDGRLVQAHVLKAGESSFDVDISAVENGTYILRLMQNGAVYANTIFSKKAGI